MKGAKKPISLKGNIYVDDATGVPIKTQLEGKLEIPPEKDGAPGTLELTLSYDVKTIEGDEIKPKEFIPEIKGREADQAPLAFLEGGARTSTIIGGTQKPVAPIPPPAPPPPAVEKTEKTETKTIPSKTTAKKKKPKNKKQK